METGKCYLRITGEENDLYLFDLKKQGWQKAIDVNESDVPELVKDSVRKAIAADIEEKQSELDLLKGIGG